MTVQDFINRMDMDYKCVIYDMNHEVEMFIGNTDEIPDELLEADFDSFGIGSETIYIYIFMED